MNIKECMIFWKVDKDSKRFSLEYLLRVISVPNIEETDQIHKDKF